MAHFAIIAPPLRGHYDPLSSLACELVSRGHRATFVHQEEARQLVSADGVGFESIGFDAASVESWTRPMAKMRGLIGLDPMLQRMVGFTDLLCREAPSALDRIGADAVIADQLEPAGGLVAEHLRLPWISAAAALAMNREPRIPPPFVPWGYDPSERGIRRNRSGWRISDFLLRKVHASIRDNAVRLGLADKSRIEDCFSPDLQISQLVAGLDFPRRDLPASFHYTGPWRQQAADHFPLGRTKKQGTVFCSLGTLQGRRTKLFHAVAQACNDLGHRLVITTGSKGSQVALGELPGSPLVHDWVPQSAVIAQADLVVSHGGMNTVLDALAAGRPLVVTPLVFEQPGTAARIAYSGAGLTANRKLSIKAAITQVLTDPRYRDRALDLAAQIATAGGASRAADLIENLIGGGTSVAAATTAHAARDDARGDNQSENSSAKRRAS